VDDYPAEARRAIEAILMVADEPIEPQILAQVTEVAETIVERICRDLAEHYEREQRGFVMVRVAGGYRFQSHPDMAAYVERFVLHGQRARLSSAALETLAIVAYKQPISRAQITSIRGVNADGVMRTLEQRGYITDVAKDPGPGQAILFGTTPEFLERLGLDSLAELPPLGAFVPGPEVVEALERGLRAIPEPDVELDVIELDVIEPDVIEPDIAEPDVAEPDVAEPNVAEPDVAEPNVAEPES
jgi:segregation and condensation protein B